MAEEFLACGTAVSKRRAVRIRPPEPPPIVDASTSSPPRYGSPGFSLIGADNRTRLSSPEGPRPVGPPRSAASARPGPVRPSIPSAAKAPPPFPTRGPGLDVPFHRYISRLFGYRRDEKRAVLVDPESLSPADSYQPAGVEFRALVDGTHY